MEDLINSFKDTLAEGMDKIAEVYEISEDNIPEFLEKVAEELEHSIITNGLSKEANFGGDFAKSFGGNPVGSAALGIGSTLASGALMGLGSMAVNKIGKSFGSSSNRMAYEDSLRRAVSGSEILREADPQKVKRLGDAIYQAGPTVAANASLLTNLLVNSIYGDSLDLPTAAAVAKLEVDLQKARDM